MTKKIPQYLKLHVEDELVSGYPKTTDIGGLTDLRNSFEQLTGWQLGYDSGFKADDSSQWSTPLDLPEGEFGRLTLEPGQPNSIATTLEDAQPLAQAIGQLLTELQRTRHVVWQREADLATAIPVAIRADDQQSLAIRMEAVLRGGAEAIGCQAAALYLLDDATSMLKMRSCWGLSKTRFLDPPRPLRGAVSDLEALVGHAVALEDTSVLPHWKVPEDYPAALCVPVATSNTPLGTLWFFADKIREFSEAQTGIAEVIAGRLVSDLEREVLVRSGYKGKRDEQALRALACRQKDQLPHVAPLIDGWQVAGKTIRGQVVGGDVLDWSVLPDGQLAVAFGDARGQSIDAALTATMIQTAIRAHAVHPHNARQMLEWLNETMWSASKGDRFASLFYGVIAPDSGRVQYAASGQVGSLICGPKRLSELSETNSQLGHDPDTPFRQVAKVIQPDQSLVLFSPTVADLLGATDDEPVEKRLASRLQSLSRPTAEEQVDAILGQVADHQTRDVSLVVIRRLF